MQSLKIISTIIAGVALLTSCKKSFLEKTDPAGVSSLGFYKDSIQVEQAINGVYGNMQGIANGQWLYNELPSDNTTVDFNPGDRGQAGYREPFEYWTVNSGNTLMSDLYNGHYSTIYNINNALKNMATATLSESVRAMDEGQLKFLRAYTYFELVQYFGDIILILEPLAKPEDAYQYNRVSQDEVYTQIIKDLTEASNQLPASYSGNNLGRVTKGSALTLLGKVYLTHHQYPDAVTALTPVLSLGYSLVPDYGKFFDPTKKFEGESFPECIWSIQYQADQGGNDDGEWSSFLLTFGPRNARDSLAGFSTENPSGFNIPTNDMIGAYEPGDLRKDASIGLNLHSKETGQVVPYIKKYIHTHSVAGRTDDNWPVLRYSDALLMLAEAINEVSGPTGDAFSYINQVRARAGLGALSGLSQSAFRDTVYHERRVELAFENWRWFDLKRTKTPTELTTFLNAYGAKERANPTISRQGIPNSNTDYIFDEYEYFYPIPVRELQINSSLVQNPGY